MNEWSSWQVGPITNTSQSFLLPSLSPLAPTWTALPTPLAALIPALPPHRAFPDLAHLAHRTDSSALAFLSFQAAHCRFRYNLLRSMRMQPLWGPRPGLINVWNSLQRLAPMLGTQLNDDLLELMFPKGIPRTNCSKLGWPLQNFYYPESSEIEFSGTSPVVQW